MKVIRPRDIWRGVPARARQWTLRLAVAFVIYLLLGFFAVPAVVKWQLLNRLPPLTQRRAAVREVKFNPLALSLTARGAQFPSNAPVQVEAGARLDAAGTVGLRATVWPYTSVADATVSVAGLDLRGFQPWLDTQMNLVFERGALNTTGRVLLGSPDGKGPKLRFTGDVAITNLLTSDRGLSQQFVRWDEFAVQDLDAELRPNKAAVRQVRFAGLKTSVLIGPDKRPNFLAILPAPRTNAAGSAAPGAAASEVKEGFPVEIGELKLEKAAIHFGDLSVSEMLIQPASEVLADRWLSGDVTGRLVAAFMHKCLLISILQMII